MVDGVVPDSEDVKRPVSVLNVEQEVDRRAPDVPTGPEIPNSNPNVGQTQQTPQTARVDIDLNNLPVRNDNEQDPVVGRRPENVLGTPASLQSTPGLVKSGPDPSTIANLEFSRWFAEMEALI